ncbi:MAG: hypothetical protein EA411_12125 [Saprospirales bacterium]|nr:MAG: hypothetical protein EA411_12125 [Saprospirales bacterium]
MDLSQQYIDKLFSSKLGNHAVEPPGHIWSNIVRKRKMAALRRKLLVGLLIALLLALLIWLLLPTRGDFPTMAAGDAAPDPTPTQTYGVPADAEDRDQEIWSQSESGYEEESITGSPETTTSGEWQNDTRSDRMGENLEATAPTTEIPIISERTSSSAAETSHTYGPDISGQSPDGSSSGDYFEAGGDILPGLGDLLALEESVLPEPFGSEADFADKDMEEESAFIRKAAMELLGVEKWKESMGHRLSEEKYSALNFNHCAIRNNPNCFEPLIPLRYFALDIMAGPDFFSKTLDPSSSEYREWVDAREASESYAISYGATARISAILQNGFALRTGVSVNQINEKFRFVDPDEERRRVVNVLIDTIINAPMDTTFVFDTLSIIETGERVRTVYNRYQMIDIPVVFGYEFNSGNWTFAPSAGFMFNIAFARRGEIISASGRPMTFEDEETGRNIFRAKLGMSVTGSFGVGYRLDSRYSIMVEPRFIYRVNPITVSEHPVSQNYFTYGVQAGLRYRFR